MHRNLGSAAQPCFIYTSHSMNYYIFRNWLYVHKARHFIFWLLLRKSLLLSLLCSCLGEKKHRSIIVPRGYPGMWRSTLGCTLHNVPNSFEAMSFDVQFYTWKNTSYLLRQLTQKENNWAEVPVAMKMATRFHVSLTKIFPVNSKMFFSILNYQEALSCTHTHLWGVSMYLWHSP